MARQKAREKIILKNNLSEIEKLAIAVTYFGERNDLSSEVIYETKLVLEEIVTNIITYGYEDNYEHQICILLNLGKEILTLEIKDDGAPFNPLKVTCNNIDKPWDGREVGGMGIHLVKNLMDKIEYKRKEGNNVVMLERYLSS